MEWKTKLPNIPEDTYGPAFEPTIIAAINELRAAIGGTTAPEATTVDTLGGATDIGAQSQTAVTTKWFALRIDVVNGGAELHEEGLIDARTLPVRLVTRQWGDVP